MNQAHDPSTATPAQGIGLRLRQARESQGRSLAEASQALHIPIRVLQALEAEEWAKVGAPVFLRGQIRSYARWLGISDDVRSTQTIAAISPPDLTPRTYTPPMRRFAEQAARRAVYVVITAAIMVPVWMASQQYIRPGASQATQLDGPATPVQGQPQQGTAHAPAPRARTPMVASLTPIPARTQAPALALTFEGESWVEITGADGSTLESGMLRGGDTRQYAAGEVARVKFGNAGVVRVEHEGQVQDLTPYIRSNVARFTVSSDGSPTPPAQ